MESRSIRTTSRASSRVRRVKEAGVCGIVATTDLPTKLRKIVVTDDQGRYLLPDLPKANYDVGFAATALSTHRRFDWRQIKIERARQCLPPMRARRRNTIRRTIGIPLSDSTRKRFSGTDPQGNGISPQMETQRHWINEIKTNCNVCHHFGNPATREIPEALGTFASSIDAWDRRLQVGQDGQGMSNFVTQMGRMRGLQIFAG